MRTLTRRELNRALLARQGYHNLYALVTGENERSCRFHKHHGYERFGVQKDTGWKHGRWHDVARLQKDLAPALGDAPPSGEPG